MVKHQVDKIPVLPTCYHAKVLFTDIFATWKEVFRCFMGRFMIFRRMLRKHKLQCNTYLVQTLNICYERHAVTLTLKAFYEKL